MTDTAGFMSGPARDDLDAALERYEAQSGHHVLVWIGRTTGDRPVEDFAARAFEAWKVGRKGLDDGLVLFIFTEDRKIRLEVGYGLEDRVPDSVAGRVIRDVMAPRIRAGDQDGAVQAGAQAVVMAIDGARLGSAAAGPTPSTGREPAPMPLAAKIVVAALFILFLVFAVRHPWIALMLLSSSRGRGGWSGGGSWSGGGGGWSGGGGRSGGGGATGGW